MKTYKYIEMYVEKHLCKNIKGYKKTECITICTLCKKCIYIQKYVRFLMF